jgi:hypothetical protein
VVVGGVCQFFVCWGMKVMDRFVSILHNVIL